MESALESEVEVTIVRSEISSVVSSARRPRPALVPVRIGRGTGLALLALVSFLAVAIHAPLHRHTPADGAHDASAVGHGPVHAACSHSAPPADERTPPRAPGHSGEDPSCSFCQLAGAARATHPVESVPPLSAELRITIAVPESSTAPDAALLLAARPRGPPALSASR
jgi:hypothetical protein